MEHTPSVRRARPEDFPRLVELVHEHDYDRLGATGAPRRRYSWTPSGPGAPTPEPAPAPG
ncbi:hypothetical protein [Streptomyces sp. NPDC058674]|uniref:hypothetical protein n=1 Tax=Streptomyces sp. NPDC058674 TaxID=3346592 RepID=UPI00364B7281